MMLKFTICLLACLGLFAESKTEADLRARLASVEARQAATLKDKGELTTALAKLTNANRSATASRESISDDVAASAAQAQATADTHAEAARIAAEDAARMLKAQSEKSGHDNNAMLTVQVLGFLTMLSGLGYKLIIDGRDRKDREARDAHLAKKIDENTNISVKAFDTANNVNEKIAANGSASSDVARELSGLRAAVEDIRLQVDQLRAAIAGKG